MEELRNDSQLDNQKTEGLEVESVQGNPTKKHLDWIFGAVAVLAVAGLSYYYYFGDFATTAKSSPPVDDPKLQAMINDCKAQTGTSEFVAGEILLSFNQSVSDAEANNFLQELGFPNRLNNDEQKDYIRFASVWKPEWANIVIDPNSPKRNERPFLRDFTDEKYIDYMRRESTGPERVALAAQIEEKGSAIVSGTDPYDNYPLGNEKFWPAISISFKESENDWKKSVVKLDTFRDFMKDNFPELEILNEEGVISLDFFVTLEVPRGREIEWVCRIRILDNPIVASVGLNGIAYPQ